MDTGLDYFTNGSAGFCYKTGAGYGFYPGKEG
jgi:hypothetical protein